MRSTECLLVPYVFRVCLLEILSYSFRIEQLLHFVIPHLYAPHWLVVGLQMFALRDFISNSRIVSALISLSHRLE